MKLRITKNNPASFENPGKNLLNEWASKTGAEKIYNEKFFTVEEYNIIENKYLSAISYLFDLALVKELKIKSVENHFDETVHLSRGMVLKIPEVLQVSKKVLRDEFWMLFENNKNCYLHFGYDYYIYIGIPIKDFSLIDIKLLNGLLIEECESPHL